MHLADSTKIIPVVECLILSEDKVLLLQRSMDTKKFPGFWIGPGGHIDRDEDVLSAAIREVKEETGVEVNTSEIELKAVGIGNHIDRNETYLVHFFVAHITSDQELTDSSEGNAQWIPIEKALKL